MATGMDGTRSSPKRRPSTGVTSFAPFSGRSVRAGTAAVATVATGSGAGLNSLAIARENSLPSGATTAGSDMSRASRMPADMKTPSMATVPVTVTSGDMKWATARPMIPPLGWRSIRPSRPSSETYASPLPTRVSCQSQ